MNSEVPAPLRVHMALHPREPVSVHSATIERLMDKCGGCRSPWEVFAHTATDH